MTETNTKLPKNFIVFWLGNLLAVIGSGMSSFAIGIYIFETTNSNSAKAFISLLAFLPGLLLSPFAGILADKYDRRKLIIASDALAGLGILLILLSLLFHFESYEIVGVGVLISSVFSSAMEPSFRATVSDLVEEKDYTKASGMIQLAGSARFLIAPILSTLVYSQLGLPTVLLMDLLTVFFTIFTIGLVSKGLVSKPVDKSMNLSQGFKEGLAYLMTKGGLVKLILLSIIMCFSMGFIEELSTPMILSFANSQTLGYAITFSAFGMVVGSLFLGTHPVKGHHIFILTLSLFLAGLSMVGFGWKENIIWVSLFGFFFFLCLPFANAILDYLVRINIPNALQGRVWGIIGIVSQMGFVLAYVLIGPLADLVFRPMFVEGGSLSSTLGKIIGVGNGRGMGFLIILAGLGLSIVSLFTYWSKDIRLLEKGGAHALKTS